MGFLFGYLLIPVVFLKSNFIKENLDLDFVLLFLFSIFYALFYSFSADPAEGKQFILIYSLSPPTFYLIGKYLVRTKPPTNTIFYILFFITAIFSISAVISVFLNFQEGGFAQLDRSIPMFWDGSPVSATIMGGFLTFNMCIPALLISTQGKKGIVFNVGTLILFILSLICVLRLGSRTQLGIFLITTVFAILYMLPRQSIKKNVWLFGLLAVVIVFLIRNVSFDLNADWLTTFAGRLSRGTGELASGGGRTERWIKSLEYMVSYPLGWEQKEFGYSHNLWLDVLRVSGIIPFIILIVYSIRSFIQIKRTVLINKESTYLNTQIIIYAIAMFLLFMMEPIFEGLFSLFVVFCIYKGIINKHYSSISQC
ncbi:O-antigen ligase family protein [Arenibacter latericius]|uniref:O-antigen ligase family protein n=1 Tax=Arenibacter latericius TaxID=86104 RepID=UPI0012FA1B04|nr:O-antigen ligase family protein [Arenibacter latericius]